MRNLMRVVICGLFIICVHTADAGRGYKKFIDHLKDPGHTVLKKKKIQAGIGLDIPLFRNGYVDIDQETRLNMNAGKVGKEDLSTFTVVKPRLDEGIFQIIWRKTTGLFKGE